MNQSALSKYKLQYEYLEEYPNIAKSLKKLQNTARRSKRARQQKKTEA